MGNYHGCRSLFAVALAASFVFGLVGSVLADDVVHAVDHGSGFFVRSESGVHEVTAKHVCRAQAECGRHSIVWDESTTHDVASRAVAEVEGQTLEPSPNPVTKGQGLVVHSPRGAEWVVVLEVFASGRFRVGGVLCQGDSGSPVLDLKGRVVGVAVACEGCGPNGCGRPAHISPLSGLRIFGGSVRGRQVPPRGDSQAIQESRPEISPSPTPRREYRGRRRGRLRRQNRRR